MTDFMAKMHQIRFRLDPAGEAYSAPRPPSCISGLLLREGEGGEGRGGDRRGGEGREESVPIVTVLRNDHWFSGSETYLSHIQSYRFICLFHLFGQEPHRLITSYWELIWEEVK